MIDASRLGELVYNSIQNNFSQVFVSHNLADTIRMFGTHKSMKLSIPAIRYDHSLFEERQVIVYTPELGSYANECNITGGWSPRRVHLGFAENSILKSISIMISENRGIISSYNTDIKWN